MPVTNALFAAILCGWFLPIIGRNLILQRNILLGLTVPQIAIAGIALVFFGEANQWPFFSALKSDFQKAITGSLMTTLPVFLLRGRLLQSLGSKSNTSIALAYLAAASVANLLLSHNAVAETFVTDLFHGRLILLSTESLVVLGVTLLGIGMLDFIFRQRILLLQTDPLFAKASQVPVVFWNPLIEIVNTLGIGVSVATAGPLFTLGCSILPVASASMLASSLQSVGNIAKWIGLGTALFGYGLSYRLDLPVGDTITALGACLTVGLWVVRQIRFRLA